jgi:TPR repeat protein
MNKIFALLLFLAALSSNSAADLKMIPFAEIRAKWSAVPLAVTKAAAEKGEASAQHYLGRIYMEGAGVPRDPKAAVLWYEKAAAQDFPNSQLNLGVWLYWGERNDGTDPARGVQLLRKAAETGEVLALHSLGRALEDEGNPAEAAENLEKAANKGHIPSMLRLAHLHSYGIIERDYQKAYSWLKKAADLGSVEAMATLAEFLSSNYENFAERPEEAKQWRAKAIARGWRFQAPDENTRDEDSGNGPVSRRNFARERESLPSMEEAQRLEQGSVADQQRAYQMYLQIAKVDPSRVGAKVGWMYEHGKGVPQDDRKALEYYGLAFGFGPFSSPAESEAAILRLIEAGRGLGTREENQALFARSFHSHGYNRPPDINLRLGRFYDEGKIVPLDMTQAVKFYDTAARQGSAEAQNRLGELWLEGVDGAPDREEAGKWFRSAAQAGYAPAQKNLERIASK